MNYDMMIDYDFFLIFMVKFDTRSVKKAYLHTLWQQKTKTDVFEKVRWPIIFNESFKKIRRKKKSRTFFWKKFVL